MSLDPPASRVSTITPAFSPVTEDFITRRHTFRTSVPPNQFAPTQSENLLPRFHRFDLNVDCDFLADSRDRFCARAEH
jgi:hypothetical protein